MGISKMGVQKSYPVLPGDLPKAKHDVPLDKYAISALSVMYPAMGVARPLPIGDVEAMVVIVFTVGSSAVWDVSEIFQFAEHLMVNICQHPNSALLRSFHKVPFGISPRVPLALGTATTPLLLLRASKKSKNIV